MTRIQSVFNQLKRVGFALLLLGWGVEPIHAAWQRIHTFEGSQPFFVKFQTPDTGWALSIPDSIGLLMSADGGVSWSRRDSYPLDTRAEAISILDSQHLAVYSGRTIVSSASSGADWRIGQLEGPYWCTSIAYADSQVMLVGGRAALPEPPYIYNDIWRSIDGGISWGDVFSMGGDFEGEISRIAYSPSGTFIVYLDNGVMLRSANKGESWDPFGIDSPVDVAKGIVSPDSAVFLIAGAVGGHPAVARSANDGLDWTIVWSDTTSAPWFRDLAVNVPGLVWIVGTDGRTLASNDGGLSWTYSQTDSSETEFENASLISSTLGYAYDRTNGVIWRWNGEFVSANLPPVPTEFSFSAFPNPFNSTLSISLTLPAHDRVEITLYNLLGREVDIIHRGRLDNTTLSYTAPPTLASGIYFLRAATTSQTQMQKVVLLK